MGDRDGSVALQRLQARMYDLITAPAGVALRLAELGLSARDLEAIVKPSAGMSAIDRVDIYANMYFYRIRDVLREEYPKLAVVLGDDEFHNLITDYLVACRPAHPSLREAGARLPGFLALHHRLNESRPWLAELARLERMRHELYDGPDCETLTLDMLQGRAPEAFPSLLLTAIPCHALLANRFEVSRKWKNLESEEPGEAVQIAAETLLVWRQDNDVYHRVVDPDEEPLLALLGKGTPFAAICDRLMDRVASTDVAAGRAFQLLGRWSVDGLIATPPGWD